jgi:hypothetical protein
LPGFDREVFLTELNPEFRTLPMGLFIESRSDFPGLNEEEMSP